MAGAAGTTCLPLINFIITIIVLPLLNHLLVVVVVDNDDFFSKPMINKEVPAAPAEMNSRSRYAMSLMTITALSHTRNTYGTAALSGFTLTGSLYQLESAGGGGRHTNIAKIIKGAHKLRSSIFNLLHRFTYN